jgi:hypothetical protein
MSENDPRARAREWLSDQLDQLDRLRNANPRDPSFKMWRQNTLTVLQRIWPGQSARSERFRRIPFSPAMPRPSGQQMREWFTKGCNEASGFLRSLLEEIDAVGLSEAPAAPVVAAEEAGADVPMLELPGAGADADPVSPSYTMDENVIELGGAEAPATSEADWHEASIPKLKVELRSPTGERSARGDSAEIAMGEGLRPLDAPAKAAAAMPAAAAPDAGAADAAPPVAPLRSPAPDATKPARAPKAKKPASRSMKLKSMLGFGSEAPAPSVAPPAAPPASPSAKPHAASKSRTMARPKLEATPAKPPVPASPAAPELDDDARAAEDFLRNSPIFGVQGRPVQRSSDVTPFQDPDAVAIATLGAELGRHGVPEAAREELRAQLAQLALQLEAGQPEWERLRTVVAGAMAWPDLARRVVPVLLPWFERAA